MGGAHAAQGAAVIGPEHVGRRVRHESGIVGVLAMGSGFGLHVLSLQGPGLPEWDDGTNWASDPADGWTLEPPAHDVHAAGWTDAAAKDQGQRAARVPVITVLSQNPPAALLVLGPGVEIPEEVHEADELLLLVRGRVVVRTTVETRLDPDGSAFSFRIGRGVAHSLRAGAVGAVLVAVMLPAAAAEVQHPDGDPFTSARWSKARGRFLGAVDEVTLWVRDRETQAPYTPGRETAERCLVDAAAGLLQAAGYAVHEIAAETGAPVPDPTPTAEPRAGEVWEDSDGEQVRLVQKRGRGELHDRVEVIGATVPRDVYPPRWRRISGTLPRMPEQTGIVEPPVPHRPAEQMQEAIVKMLREQAELAGKYSAADAADDIEAGKHLAFIEPPVPHRSGA